MWGFADLGPVMPRRKRHSCASLSQLPHLAKGGRDMGHPRACRYHSPNSQKTVTVYNRQAFLDSFMFNLETLVDVIALVASNDRDRAVLWQEASGNWLPISSRELL